MSSQDPRYQAGSWARPVHPEYEVLELRRSGLGLTGVAVRLVVLAGVAGYLLGVVPLWLKTMPELISPARWVVAGLAAVLLLGMVARRFASWASSRATVTTRRVTIRYKRRAQGWDIPMLSIVDVASHSGLLQRIFGVGTLTIHTSFARQPAVLLDVPRAANVRDAIQQLRTQEWAAYQRSVSATPYTSAYPHGKGMRAAS